MPIHPAQHPTARPDYAAPTLPAPGSTGLRLLSVRGSEPDAPAPEVRRVLELLTGQRITLAGRGLRICPWLVAGQICIAAVGATGDAGARWRLIPVTASVDEILLTERELLAELDRDEPVRLAVL